MSYLPAIVCIAGNLSGGYWAGSNIAFSLLLLPLAELVLGENKSNHHSDSHDTFPAAILYGHVILHSVVVISLYYGYHQGILNGIYFWLAVISSGIAAGSGAVVVAHELIHKAGVLKQMCGKWLLFLSGNVYFRVHHLRIHHRDVGTPHDAATARKGESLHRFFLRTVRQQLAQGWESEQRRLEKAGSSVWSVQNEIIRNVVYQLLLMMFLALAIDFTAAFSWLLFSFIASFLLEYVNYIEHYGLVREIGDKVNHTHSWNCDKVVSRFFLVDLSRHADHHFHASRPYHALNSVPDSPSLPGGYTSMILPALIPPLWFALVHPRLDSAKKSQ